MSTSGSCRTSSRAGSTSPNACENVEVRNLEAGDPGTIGSILKCDLCHVLYVTRSRDASGHRVFAVTTGERVLDSAGLVVSQRFGPPINTTFTRRSP